MELTYKQKTRLWFDHIETYQNKNICNLLENLKFEDTSYKNDESASYGYTLDNYEDTYFKVWFGDPTISDDDEEEYQYLKKHSFHYYYNGGDVEPIINTDDIYEILSIIKSNHDEIINYKRR